MKNWVLILSIIAFLSLSLPQLFNREIWFDEMASISLSQRSLDRLLEISARDTHPPLYFLLLKGWSELSQNRFFLRSLSLIFAGGSILIMWQLTHTILPKRNATIVTILFAVSPLHIYYATEIRMYALFLFETIVLTHIFLRFVHNPSAKISLLNLCFELAAMYTHYYSALIIIPLSVWLLLNKRLLITRWLVIQLICALLFLPWILFTEQFPKPDCWCFPAAIGAPTFFATVASGGVGMVTITDLLRSGNFWLIIPFLISAVFAFILFIKGVLKTKLPSDFLLFIFFIPLSIVTALSLFKPWFSPRALIFLLPAYLIYATVGIFSFKNYAKPILVSFVVLLTLISLTQSIHPFFTHIPIYKRDLDVRNLELFRP